MRLHVGLIAGLLAVGSIFAEDEPDGIAGPSLTVYSRFGYIKEKLTINLAEGQGEYTLNDIPALALPQTITAHIIDQEAALNILQQSYLYGALNHKSLLDSFVGKTIQVENWNLYQDRKETVEALVLNNDDNGTILQINGKVYLDYPGIKVLPSVPPGVNAKSALSWTYHNEGPGQRQIELSYMTGGLSWSADYALYLDSQANKAQLSGWATVANRSGRSYRAAHVDLIAGEINATVPAPSYAAEAYDSNAAPRMFKAQSSQMIAQNVSEYHFYSIPQSVNLLDNQDTQVALLSSDDVEIKKEYTSRGMQNYYSARYENGIGQPVEFGIRFRNSNTNHLRTPLPAGTVRVFMQMAQGGTQFIGEQSIVHTPEGEEVKLAIGKAFDLLVDRNQLSFDPVTSKMQESEWEIKVKNRKDESVVLSLIEPVYGAWEILSSSHNYVREDAYTFRFDVPVPKGSEVTVRYKVRINF